MVLLGDDEAAEPERQAADRRADRADAEGARQRERPERRDRDVEHPQQQEPVDGRPEPCRQQRRRVERADLALGEEREAPEDVRRPERQLAGPQRGVKLREDRDRRR